MTDTLYGSLYAKAVANSGISADITREDVTVVAEEWASLVLTDSLAHAMVTALLKPLVQQKLIREPARKAEQAAARDTEVNVKGDTRKSARGTGLHKRSSRVSMLGFLDTQVMLRHWPDRIAPRWGDLDIGRVREIFEDRRIRYESFLVAKDFAFDQLSLMQATGAATLREAYEISGRIVPDSVPGAGDTV